MEKAELLKLFIHDELTENDKEEFIRQIQSDPDFEKDVEIESLMYANRSAELKNYLNSNQINTISNSSKVQSIKEASRKTLFKIVRNVAAILLLSLLSYYSFNLISTNSAKEIEFFEQLYAERYMSPGVIQSSNNEYSYWDKAKVHYSNEKHELAEQEILNIENPTIEQQLYLALSMLYKESPDFRKSISIFKQIIDHPNNIDKDATSWYLAIAYLRSNQNQLAKPILEKIATSSHFKNKKAKEVLERISTISHN